jgi:hypothetical protein
LLEALNGVASAAPLRKVNNDELGRVLKRNTDFDVDRALIDADGGVVSAIANYIESLSSVSTLKTALVVERT